MKTPQSNCCHAPVKAHIADEGTGHYECTACHKACDVKAGCCPKCNFKGVAHNTKNIAYFGEEYCGKPDCPCHIPPAAERTGDKGRVCQHPISTTGDLNAPCGICTPTPPPEENKVNEFMENYKIVKQWFAAEGDSMDSFGDDFILGRMASRLTQHTASEREKAYIAGQNDKENNEKFMRRARTDLIAELVGKMKGMKSHQIEDYINSTEGGDVPEKEIAEEQLYNTTLDRAIEIINSKK